MNSKDFEEKVKKSASDTDKFIEYLNQKRLQAQGLTRELKDLSEFKGRDVELFRSSDLNNTAIYFTDVEYNEQDKAEAYFELLRFGISGGDHQIYLRFPNEEHFKEMIGGGFGSGRGDMKSANGKNVFCENGEQDFIILSHGENLLIKFDDLEMNFMKKVASYDKGNKFCKPYPNETFVNFEEIEKAISMKYIKLPEDVRKIQYCFKTKDSSKFFLVDFPAYNFQYTKHNFFFFLNGESKRLAIDNFVRYRDGGTTKICVIDDNGEKHNFFSPQTMFPSDEQKYPLFDDIELIEASDSEKEEMAKLLNLNLELEPVTC